MYVSKELYRLAQDYLERVDQGDLSENRTWLHDRLMFAMRTEGVDFANRQQAADLARQFKPVPDSWEEVPTMDQIEYAIQMLKSLGLNDPAHLLEIGVMLST